jgi:hypothetical protein
MSSWLDQWVELPIDGDQYEKLLKEKIEKSDFKKITKEATVDIRGSH